MDAESLEDVVKVVNCAGCGAVLLGRSMVGLLRTRRAAVQALCRIEFGQPLHVCAGHIRGRPYCDGCLDGQIGAGKPGRET